MRKYLWKDGVKISYILLFLLAFFFSYRQLSSYDLGFHLKGGQYIFENLKIPYTDSYTFSAEGNKYIDIHWFFQVIIYITYKVSGYKGLSILNVILSMSFLYVIIKILKKKKVNEQSIILTLLIVLFITNSRFILRPEILSLIFIATIFYCLESFVSDYKKKWLYIIIVIHLIWVNSHGLFVLGWIVLFVYYVKLRMKKNEYLSSIQTTLLLCILVCFVNPYFIDGFLYPLQQFLMISKTNGVYSKIISELNPFWKINPNFSLFYLSIVLFIIISIIGVFLNLKKNKTHEIIICVLFLYLSLIAIRNIPLFVIFASPFFAYTLSQLKYSEKTFRLLNYAISIISFFLIVLIVKNKYYKSSSQLNYITGSGVNKNIVPIDAANFIKEKNISGKILNNMNCGGWISWLTGEKIFIDARHEVMTEKVLMEELNSGYQGGLSILIKKYNPDIILFEHHTYYSWVSQLTKIKGFKLAYLDENFAMYLKKDNYPLIPEFNSQIFISDHDLLTVLDEIAIQELINKIEKKESIFLEFEHNQNAENYKKLAHFFELNQINMASEGFLLKALYENPGINNLKSLYVFYLKFNNYDKAELCINQIMKVSKKDAEAHYLMGLLYKAKNNYQYAVNEFSESIKINEKHADSYDERGVLRALNNDYSGALSDFSKAIKISPEKVSVYNNRALLYFKNNKYNDALNDINDAIKISPYNDILHIARGQILLMLNNVEGACYEFETAYNLNPENKESLRLLQEKCIPFKN